MKSAEEMILSVKKRRDEEQLKIRKRNRVITALTGAAAGFAVLAVVLLTTISFKNDNIVTGLPETSSERTETSASDDAALAPRATTADAASDAETSSERIETSASDDAAFAPGATTADAASDAHISGNKPANDETETPAQTGTSDIIWTGTEKSGRSTAAEEVYLIREGDDRIWAGPAFYSCLEKAAGSDVLAFCANIVVQSPSGPDEELQRLSNRMYELSTASAELLSRVTERLRIERYITEVEAAARATMSEEYLAAREAYHEAAKAKALRQGKITYDAAAPVVAGLEKMGFSVIASSDREEFFNYARSGVVILAGTKDMIMSLDIDKLAPAEYITLSGAKRNSGDIIFGEGEMQVHLQNGSKLTDELLAAYDENGGAALTVSVKMGWDEQLWGEWVDPHHYAYEAIGLHSEQEFNEAGDDILTAENVNRYYEVLNQYTYWVNEERVAPLLREGELVEIRSYAWDFTAKLTKERAEELCANRCVAYITLPDIREYTREYEITTD